MIKYISQTAKIHPNSVSRSFKRHQMNKVGGTKKNGRPIYYTADVNYALKDIWETANCPCGELLHPMILDYVNGFKQEGRWKHWVIRNIGLFKMMMYNHKKNTYTSLGNLK